MIDTKEIVNDIRIAIKNGHKKILFDNIAEGTYFDIIRKIHRIIKLVDDSSVEYYYLCSSYNSDQAYMTYCEKHNINPVLKMIKVNYFEMVEKAYLEQYLIENPKKTITYEIKNKSKIFNCFNKAPRQHRVEIFYNILRDGYLDKTYSSFQFGKEIADHYIDKEIRKMYVKHSNIFPLLLGMSSERPNPVDVRDGDFLYHNDSYFSLVTETLFYKNFSSSENCVFLTEKTFRPIIHKHPFIIVGSTGCLAYLKKYGYKTFAPFIDESYDSIIDDEQRLNAIWKEVVRLSNFSNEEWLEWQQNVASIVEHNYDVIMNKNYTILE